MSDFLKNIEAELKDIANEPSQLSEKLSRVEKLVRTSVRYANAPSRLHDKYIWLKSIIEKNIAAGAKPETLKDYNELAEAILLAEMWMADISFIIEEANYKDAMYQTMANMLSLVQDELNQYKAIESSMLDGTLLEKIKSVQEKVRR